jgi:hypothetical protein
MAGSGHREGIKNRENVMRIFWAKEPPVQRNISLSIIIFGQIKFNLDDASVFCTGWCSNSFVQHWIVLR